MEYWEKIDTSLLRIDFNPGSKDDALRQIAALARHSALLAEVAQEEVYRRLTEREAAVSTGIGGGVAIPHARFSQLRDFLVFVLVSPRGVEFGSLDKKKVRLFFVVFAPEDKVSDHLKLLASISRAVSQSSFKQELLNTTEPGLLHEIITRHQSGTLHPVSSRKKLLFIILYYEKDLQDVLEYLLERGIDGATIMQSSGMGAYISNIPLFVGFLSFMREDRNVSNTVMALIPENDEADIVQGIESITGDLDKNQGAMLLSVDVSFYKGSMSML